ncbi:GNAT family N-acetyltransferase [uncultured Chryseobacterium sp.]|uniref:GNAT family N-acetyltransferase n=1 Tax=uncultured Chryseobacterium sp. TaxID=259322 RepID=UPI0025FD89D5|nr:GNAT family N-acetyltransferase [uncultured Chryseobacterium sp.]
MNQVPEELLEKWLTGWSISRGKPLPEAWESGYRVLVGDGKQKARYVFPKVNKDFIQLAESIHEPWVYLKVCEPFEKFRSVIPERWQIQPQGYMMYCQEKMNIRENPLPDDYSMKVFQPQPDSFMVKIYTANKQVAAVGRLILVDGLAVYDRVETDKDYQRKGFATQIIKELEFIALSKGIVENFLVATAQGKLLYESLGWKIYSLYSTIVIPEDH